MSGVAREQPENTTLINVQALRATAALMVVVVHLYPLLKVSGTTEKDTGMFAAGVDLFFVISGFIMVYTTAKHSPSPLRFLADRIARVVPIYWVITVIAFIGALFVPGAFGGTVAKPLDMIRSLLFIPYARADGLMRPILFVGWSLNLEMVFYVLFAVSLALARPAWRYGLIIGVLVGLVAIHTRYQSQLSIELMFLTQPIILNFAIGMFVGIVHDRLPNNHLIQVAALITLPLSLGSLLWLSRHPSPVFGASTMLPAAAVLLAALTLERGGRQWRSPTVIALGDASYALYLTHPFVTQAVTKLVFKFQIITSSNATLLALLALLFSALIAVVIHRTVERPLSMAVRHLFHVGSHPISRLLKKGLAIAP